MNASSFEQSVLATQVGDQLRQLMAQIACATTADVLLLLQRSELSMSRALALMFLERQPCASLSDMSRYLNLSLGNTSHLVEQLVCSGYVTRTEDVNDRRVRQVMLTSKGEAFVQEIKAIRVRQLAARLEDLPVTVLHSAAQVFADILEHVRLTEESKAQPDIPTAS
ncbi:MAG: MarR family transcriptional regulator [Caldilineaceae bacterium]